MSPQSPFTDRNARRQRNPNEIMVHLPIDIQLLLIDHADWTQLPNLMCVCHVWRTYILRHVKTRFIADRYTYQRLPLNIGARPRNAPQWHFHKLLTYVTHIIFLNGKFIFAHLGPEQLTGPPRWSVGPFWRRSGMLTPPENDESNAIPQMRTLDVRIFADDPVIIPHNLPCPVVTPIPPGSLRSCIPSRLPYYTPFYDGPGMIEEYNLEFNRIFYPPPMISPSTGMRLATFLLLRKVGMAAGWPPLVDRLGRRRGLVEIEAMYRMCGNGTMGITFRMKLVSWEHLNRASEVVRVRFL